MERWFRKTVSSLFTLIHPPDKPAGVESNSQSAGGAAQTTPAPQTNARGAPLLEDTGADAAPLVPHR